MMDAQAMTRCPHCATNSPPGSKFCQQCGKPLAAAADSDATVLMSATQVAARGGAAAAGAPRQQEFDVTALFAARDRIVIGRAPDCDIYLPHPLVTRYHA